MHRSILARLTLLAAVAASLAGCALLPDRPGWVKITPIERGGRADTRDDHGYALAVAAINRRDYAAALDHLQIARAADPQDVRVLNAFGVVYDKLDRFDLSARYYAEAKALDPASAVVASNIAYSQVLQERAARVEALEITPAEILAFEEEPRPMAAVATLAPGPTPVSAPAVLKIAATPPAPIRLAADAAPKPFVAPGVTGRPLLIVNATGAPRSVEPIRLHLAARGWSAPVSAMREGPRRSHTIIVYAEASRREALALARTLHRPVALVACADGCVGLRLTVAADALAWPSKARTAPARRG